MDLSTTNLVSAARGARSARLLAVSLALLALPALAACGGEEDGEESGQAAGPGKAASGMQTQGSPAMQEYRQLAQELDSIRQQAMQDSALRAQQADLRDAIQSEMEDDPQTQALVARFDSVRQAFQDAQASGDSAAMQQLMPQLQRMQMQIQQAQGQVAQDPGIASQIDSFRENLQDHMEEVDPEAREKIDRADSLVQRLRQQMSAPAGSAAAGAGAGDTTGSTGGGGR